MVQSIGPARLDAVTPPPPPAAERASLYAADWRAPATTLAASPAPLSPVGSAAPGPDPVTRAKQNALLSADVYHATPNPPPGFRVADQADLDRLNITPAMLEQPGSSFRARVYATGEGANERYVVAFRGSSSGEDWKNNFQQGVGLHSESYRKAIDIGRALAQSDAPVTLTGHSLGGGLASAAAVASGNPADTFNAAGLHDDSIARAQSIARSNGRGAADVEAYSVPGEILTFVQEGGDRLLGGVFGGIVGALVADAPPAYGTRHTLPEAVPEGKSWLQEHSRIDRHMIDWVLAGAAALR